MGAAGIAALLKWPSIAIGVALVVVWGIGRVRSGIVGSAVAKDDLEEKAADEKAIAAAQEAMRNAPKTWRDVVARHRARLRNSR